MTDNSKDTEPITGLTAKVIRPDDNHIVYVIDGSVTLECGTDQQYKNRIVLPMVVDPENWNDIWELQLMVPPSVGGIYATEGLRVTRTKVASEWCVAVNDSGEQVDVMVAGHDIYRYPYIYAETDRYNSRISYTFHGLCIPYVRVGYASE